MRYLAKVGFMLALGAASSGCDPNGAGAAGVISLGAGVSTEGFTTLKFCAAPEPEESPEGSPEGPPAGSFPETCEISQEVSLTDVKFPYPYEINAGLGTTEHPRWRLVVWLTADAKSTKPASGDPFALMLYSVASCGAGVEQYCGLTSGVDLVLKTNGI